MKSEQIVNAVELFRDYIRFKYNSENTAINYGSAVTSFLAAFPEVSRPADINADQIIQYLLNNFPNLSSRRNAHSAIKLFYKFKSKNGFSNKFRFIEYPEKPDTIPDHVTPEDFIQIMRSCNNVMHRCILMLGYDAGFRVSEVVNLKLTSIDFELMQLKIRQSKGRKDRIVKLSVILKNFIISHINKNHPVEYLFNGQGNAPQYSVRSCEEILTTHCLKAGVKHYKFHALRHGFAMALYEDGYSLETIRDLLGHSNVKTTEIYARKNNKVIQRTTSPVERIFIEHQNRLTA